MAILFGTAVALLQPEVEGRKGFASRARGGRLRATREGTRGAYVIRRAHERTPQVCKTAAPPARATVVTL
jgi:hypothetical protein